MRYGFRQRGCQTTRVEAFTDAAFAFAVTLLVISLGRVPPDFESFLAALREIPIFAASFAQIAFFWHAHHLWSRRYGLDDLPTVFLSLLLVFVTLIYVYPLRVVFSGFFFWISRGWVPYAFDDSSPDHLRWIFVIYGVGFAAMSLVILLLYRHARRRAAVLELDARERFVTDWEVLGWSISVGVGIASLLLALLLPRRYAGYSGFAYASLGVLMPLLAHRKLRRLEEIPGGTGVTDGGDGARQ